MRILGTMLVLVGLYLGLNAFFSFAGGDGSLACISSLLAMSGGTLLFQEMEHPVVSPILSKFRRQRKQAQS